MAGKCKIVLKVLFALSLPYFPPLFPRALNEMLKCQASMRNHLRFMIDAVQRDQNEELHSQVIQRVMSLSRNLPEPPKANDCLKKFYRILLDDQRIREHLAKLTSPDCPCKKAEEHVVSCDVFYTPVRCFGLYLPNVKSRTSGLSCLDPFHSVAIFVHGRKMQNSFENHLNPDMLVVFNGKLLPSTIR